MKYFTGLTARHGLLRAIGPVLLLLYGLNACTEAGEYTARSVRIFDGDSFIATRSNGVEIEIRLFGIDAPERHQPWSRKSREALGELLRDTDFSVSTVTIDRYDRTVAVVTLPDGRQVNSEMIRAGHAWVYRRYTDDDVMLALEDQAKKNKLGLWRLPPAERIPPWEWRSQKRK
ncbi:MAG: thermonuclease family protein [Gammaproteobacteria bacterium]